MSGGSAEARNLEGVVLGDQDVFWLEIAVADAGCVTGFYCGDYLQEEIAKNLFGHRTDQVGKAKKVAVYAELH